MPRKTEPLDQPLSVVSRLQDENPDLDPLDIEDMVLDYLDENPDDAF